MSICFQPSRTNVPSLSLPFIPVCCEIWFAWTFSSLIHTMHCMTSGCLKQCSEDWIVTVKVSLCKGGIRSGLDDGHGSWKWRHLCRVMKQQQHYTLPHCRLIEAVRAAGTQQVLQTAWWIPEWVLIGAVYLSGDWPTWAWPGLCSWFVWLHFASAGHSCSACLLEHSQASRLKA